MATTWLTCTRESFYLNIFWSSEKKPKYHQYKYKIKDAFHRHEPLWTMYESKWGRRLGKTLAELKKLRKAGHSYVDCCDPV